MLIWTQLLHSDLHKYKYEVTTHTQKSEDKKKKRRRERDSLHGCWQWLIVPTCCWQTKRSMFLSSACSWCTPLPHTHTENRPVTQSSAFVRLLCANGLQTYRADNRSPKICDVYSIHSVTSAERESSPHIRTDELICTCDMLRWRLHCKLDAMQNVENIK